MVLNSRHGRAEWTQYLVYTDWPTSMANGSVLSSNNNETELNGKLTTPYTIIEITFEFNSKHSNFASMANIQPPLPKTSQNFL